MKTLLLENYYANRNYIPIIFLILIIYAILFIGSMGYGTYIVMASSVFSVSILMRSFYMDSYYKWPYSALTLPINRKKYIQSKFVILYLSLLLGLILSIGICFIYYIITRDPVKESGELLSLIIITGFSYNLFCSNLAILFNILFENGKYLMFFIYIIPIGIFYLLQRFLNINFESLKDFIYLSPVLALIASFIIYLISVRIYSRKDL